MIGAQDMVVPSRGQDSCVSNRLRDLDNRSFLPSQVSSSWRNSLDTCKKAASRLSSKGSLFQKPGLSGNFYAELLLDQSLKETAAGRK